jgi:hypothetical protein
MGPQEITVRYWADYLQNGFKILDEPRKELGGDTFLEVSPETEPAPVLDLGANGDRAGGIGRPTQPIRYLARVGPVSLAHPASPPSTSPGLGDQKFFNKEAKLLGLIDLNAFVDELLQSASAESPQLQEVLTYTVAEAELVRAAIKVPVRSTLQPLKEDTVIQRVYPNAARAYSKLDPLLDQPFSAAQDQVKAVTQFVSSGRELLQELDRISEAPIAPLTDAIRQSLIEVQQVAEQGLTNVFQGWTLSLPPVLGRVLIPLTLQGVLPRLAEGEPTNLLPGDFTALAPLFPAGVDAALSRPLPDTLTGFREKAVREIAQRLNHYAESLPEGTLRRSAVIHLAENLPTAAGTLRTPRRLDQLYGRIRALANTDILAAMAGLSDVWTIVEEWTRGDAEGLCTSAAKALQAVLAAILPAQINPAGCPQHAACVEAAALPSASLCGVLWTANCDLPNLPSLASLTQTFRTRTGTLAASLNQLQSVFAELRQFVTIPDPVCDVLPLDAVQEVDGARTAFTASLTHWGETATQLIQAADPQITVPLKRQICRAYAMALEILVPGIPDEARLRSALQAVLTSADAASVAKALHDRLAAAQTIKQSLLDAAEGRSSPSAAIATATSLGQQLDAITTQMQTAIDAALLKSLSLIGSQLDAPTRLAIQAVAKLYTSIITVRNKAVNELTRLQRKVPTGGLMPLLVVPPVTAMSPQPQDKLQSEANSFVVLASQTSLSFGQRLAAVKQITGGWDGASAPQRLRDQIRVGGVRAFSAAALELISVDELRARLKSELDRLLPTKKLLAYDYTLPINPRDGEGGVIKFSPDVDNPKLMLRARTELDLQTGKANSSEFKGDLSAFKIEIAPGGKSYLTLHFGDFQFVSGDQGTHFDAPLRRVEIGPELKFLEALGEYLGWKQGGGSSNARNGPYILPRSGGPGVRAGFGLNIGTISVGAMGFANVFFDSHCELPFDANSALMRVSLSSREAPFTMFASLYGGSGYLGLVGSAKGIQLFDTSLEWGGASAIAYGPLEGVGRIMTGVYIVQQSGGGALISGTFTAGFVGHVACFGIAASFYVAMTQKGGGEMSGEATLTYTFSVGIHDVSFRVRVVRNQPQGFKTTFSDNPVFPTRYAQLLVTAPGCAEPDAYATTAAVSPLQNWDRNRRYFDTGPRPLGGRYHGRR